MSSTSTSTPKAQGWGRKAKKSNYLQQIMAPEAVPNLAPRPPEPLNWAAERDFTERSIQISASPQLRLRNAKLDQIYQDESILSSQEDEEEVPEALSDQEDRSKPRRDTTAIAALRSKRRSEQNRKRLEMSAEKGVEDSHERTVLEEEGEPIPGTPITIFSKPAKRVELKREDSHDLLRNLSRSFSRSDSSPPPNWDADPEERITGEARLFDLLDNKSEKGSSRAQTPPPAVDPMTLPTPKVTGAFIETPATVRNAYAEHDRGEGGRVKSRSRWNLFSNGSGETPRPSRLPRRPSRDLQISHEEPKRRHFRTTSREQQLKNTHVRPSASEDLQNIIQEAGGDDSTLDPTALGALMTDVKAPPPIVGSKKEDIKETPNEELAAEDIDDILEAEANSEEELMRIARLIKPLLDRERAERRLANKKGKGKGLGLEEEALSLMDQHLRKTSSSIRDARHGIERLEQQVSSQETQIRPSVEDSSAYIALKIPRLWRKGRPTWFGWIVSAIVTWYILENLFCFNYCRDRLGGGSYKDPFYGWVIPTKLDDWTGKIISSTFPLMWDVFEMMATGEESRLLKSGKKLTEFQLDILDPLRELRNYPGMLWKDRKGRVIR